MRVTLCLAVPGLLAAEDWPHWLGPERNGRSEEVLPASPDLSGRAWEAELGTGFSSFAVAEGRVFSMGHADGRETVWCFSEESGELLWSDSYEAELLPNLHEGGPGATPAVSGGRVFTLSKDGQLRAYDAARGTLHWERDVAELANLVRRPPWGYTGSPVVWNGELLVEAGATFAFDPETGEERWRSETFRPAYGSPQPFPSGDRTLVATLKTDGLVILDPDGGRTLAEARWRTSFQTNSTTPLFLGEGRLFISTGYDRGCALFHFDGDTLTKRYENRNMCNHMGNSVPHEGYIYGFDGTAHRGRPVEFTCIDVATGEKQWQVRDYRYGSVIGASDDLIVLTEEGMLLVGRASPRGFEPRARARVLTGRCWTPPVLANGRIYARNAAGRAVAVPVR